MSIAVKNGGLPYDADQDCATFVSKISNYCQAAEQRCVRASPKQISLGNLVLISQALYGIIDDRGNQIGKSGFIFRNVNRQGVGRQLHLQSINRRLRQLQKLANLENIETLSGHFFRVGGPLGLLDNGKKLTRTMLRGGWKAESTAINYPKGTASYISAR